MAQTAAHLVDHVIPPVSVRQWVISVPKRLRWFLAERSEAVAALTRIFVSEVERLVREASGLAAPSVDRNPPRIGAISFLHRFGSALNRHVHLHVCVTDGVFRRATTEDSADITEPAVSFLPCRRRPLTRRVEGQTTATPEASLLPGGGPARSEGPWMARRP
jgi:hypothetical protein